jgi:glutaredoxin
MKQLLPQQCPLPLLYLTWAVYLAVLVYLTVTGNYSQAVIWLVGLPLAWWAYVRLFPRISQYLGYGAVDDVAAEVVAERPVMVTMYGTTGCPFCPIVEGRLRALQERMRFELEYVDVMLRPKLAIAKGIRSLPVVEVGDRRLVGNATTQLLAEVIAGAG